MRVTIRDNDGNVLREVQDTYENLVGCDAIQVYSTCPHCQRSPYAARFLRQREDAHGMEGDAYCDDCGGTHGTMRVDFDTIFGAEEDRAVLIDGRPRVYWSNRG